MPRLLVRSGVVGYFMVDVPSRLSATVSSLITIKDDFGGSLSARVLFCKHLTIAFDRPSIISVPDDVSSDRVNSFRPTYTNSVLIGGIPKAKPHDAILLYPSITDFAK